MKYKGKIQMHFEQGCGEWPQFHDDRGRHGDKLQFWNWDYTINFNWKTKLDKLFIYSDDGEVLYDESFSSRNPIQAGAIDYILKTNNQLNCEIETDEVLEAFKDKL